MTPFLYSKSKHQRREQPPQYKNYKRYKPYLRREFERKCIYCRLPDTLKGKESFGVEHYKPKQKNLFPELELVYNNLFYACNCCNSRKGAFWPSQEQLNRDEFIPNPCDHVMFQHLKYAGSMVETKTAAGDLCKEILDLNDEDSVLYREFLLGVIETCAHERDKWQALIIYIDSEIDNPNTSPEHQKKLLQERPFVETKLNECIERVKKLLGDS